MLSRVGCGALVIAVCSMGVASAARAQLRVELGASIGRYAPLGSFDRTSVHEVSLPTNPGDLGGTALGGELRLWVAPRIGFALAGSTVSSDVGGGSTPNGYHPPGHARVSTGSAQMLFRVTSDNNRARVWLSAGGGIVQHAGAAYERFDSPVNVGGVFGVGSAIRIKGGWNAELGLTTMVYNMNASWATPAFDDGVSERGMQTDLQLRMGLSYTIH